MGLVPKDERELAAQVRQAIDAEVLVEMQRDLAVRARPEPVSGVLQLTADPFEVVELAVDDDPRRFVLVGDRLVAGGEVDDA